VERTAEVRRIDIPYFMPESVVNTPGETWTDSTGVDWCVFVAANDEAIGGAGNALIITREVFGHGTGYNATVPWVIFENSSLKGVMTTWDTNNASINLRGVGLNYTFQNDSDRAAVGAGIETQNELMSSDELEAADAGHAVTLPVSNIPSTGQVFALSATEANRYLPYRIIADAGNDCRSRQAERNDTEGIPASWWVRSPGSSVNAVSSMNAGTGHITASGGHQYRTRVPSCLMGAQIGLLLISLGYF